MRSLFGLLLLLPYYSHGFTVSCSKRASLFGTKQAPCCRAPYVAHQHHASLNPALPSIIHKDNTKTLNAFTRVGNDSDKTSIASRLKRWVLSFRRATKMLLVAAFFAFACFIQSASAVSGGRMGGSFSPSSSRSSGGTSSSSHSMHRSSGYRSSGYSSSSRGYGGPSRTNIIYSPIRLGPSYYPTRLCHSAMDAPVSRRFGVGDAVVLGGTGIILYSALTKRSRDGSKETSALGEGTSVASITLSMTVPDRDDFYSILNKLKRLAESADTSTRLGVQTLVSTVAMELLRDESSITAARTTYSHFSNPNQAEREFQRISVSERSKFDKETVNKYGGMDISQIDQAAEKAIQSKATEAVVTISLAIQGDQTELPEIRSREDLLYALTRIAADAPVEDCLVSAEVLWAPELRSEQLTRKDIFADHPDLYPV